jgi:hypothetical protein
LRDFLFTPNSLVVAWLNFKDEHSRGRLFSRFKTVLRNDVDGTLVLMFEFVNQNARKAIIGAGTQQPAGASRTRLAKHPAKIASETGLEETFSQKH